MFTGLIEDVGEIKSLRVHNRAAVLAVQTQLPARTMLLGASIAVNGVCLTVVKKVRRALRWTFLRRPSNEPASKRFEPAAWLI